MSADYNIYSDYLDEFDRADFERWALAQGYEIELHPDFSIREHGFVPIRFRADFAGQGSWQSGFELFADVNDVIDMTAPAYEPPVKKQGFFTKLFGKKHQPISQPPEYMTAPAPGEPSEFERACAEKKWSITAACFGSEPLEVLCCYLFIGYFVEKFGAVAEDPQMGRFYENAEVIKAEFTAIQADILANHSSWGQKFRPFEGWE